MKPLVHQIYIGTMVSIVIIVTIYMIWTGYSYYILPLEERFYHPRYDWFKPSGVYGQGLGILGTLMILFGVSIYIARKRYGFLEKYIRLKYLLEFHIFLCTMGPMLVLFHTTFKFGGIVSVAFWSMVAVVLSGVIGRFIYIQIPRTIEGRELSLNEIQSKRSDLSRHVEELQGADEEVSQRISDIQGGVYKGFKGYFKLRFEMAGLKTFLKQKGYARSVYKEITGNIKEEIALQKKLGRLRKMQKLFRYWHVAHLPFALIMLVIVVIHVAVSLALGYKWIF